ncbi:MAG TPA: PAS domain-containing protein [Persephonella sp.]|uniref:Adenylate/guanylate cyclase n=1 Tax=Persephonella marina (strain DSM 14350 / EX-H1) TaxID=123214 RepID=C0QTI9_PERMH|nr:MULTISPECIES: GAF domain-containing protein [Persephonella]ACO03236.1 adenylate/guanylate cyclase [Persephonella marina EX-H1]HCB70379.1 PAS domain-containing protein [Persephonella sp.]
MSYEDFIYNLTKTILQDFDIKTLFINVTDQIRKFIGAERSSLFFYDREKNLLRSVVISVDQNVDKIEIPVDKESIAGYTALEKRILNIKDIHDKKELSSIDPDLKYHNPWLSIKGVETRSMLSVPVIKDGEVLGVFQAINKDPYFTEKDEEILGKITPLIAIALDNVIKYSKMRIAQNIEKVILENISEAVVLLDNENRIITFNSQFGEMTGYRFSRNEAKNKKIEEILPIIKAHLDKIDFVRKYMIPEEITLDLIRIRMVPIIWECVLEGRFEYVGLIFHFPRG